MLKIKLIAGLTKSLPVEQCVGVYLLRLGLRSSQESLRILIGLVSRLPCHGPVQDDIEILYFIASRDYCFVLFKCANGKRQGKDLVANLD